MTDVESKEVISLEFRGIVYGADGQLQEVSRDEALAHFLMNSDSSEDGRSVGETRNESRLAASDGDDEAEDEDEYGREDWDEDWEDTDYESSNEASEGSEGEQSDESPETEESERIYPDGLPVSPYLPLLHVNWSFLHAARQKLYRE